MKKLLLVLLLCISFCASAQISNTLSYQGVLMQSDGVTPITDGNHSVIFNFYTQASGGSPTFSRTVTVSSTKGLFTCIIGGGTGANAPLPAGIGNQQWYIGIRVDEGTELTPRTQLTPSPYAYAALTNETGAGPVPPGGIIMWSGSVASIPAGWALCDGTNDTPDLRGRFIVGYQAGSSDYGTIGNTGGASAVTLTTNQIPTHNHTASTVADHTHTGTTGSNGNHSHSYGWYQGVGSSQPSGNGGGSWTTRNTGDAGSHSHTFTTAGAGSHTHTIGNTGGGLSHENRPPYYVLAYIMKK